MVLLVIVYSLQTRLSFLNFLLSYQVFSRDKYLSASLQILRHIFSQKSTDEKSLMKALMKISAFCYATSMPRFKNHYMGKCTYLCDKRLWLSRFCTKVPQFRKLQRRLNGHSFVINANGQVDFAPKYPSPENCNVG